MADPRLAYLLDRYGVRMRLADAARELGMATQTAHNRRSRGTFPCATFRDGGAVWVDTVALAEHQAAVAAAAQEQHRQQQARLAPAHEEG